MTRASALHAVVAAAAAWSLHHHAGAQLPCRPVDCTNVPHLQPGQTWVPVEPNWTIDRRPVIVIAGWNGNFCDNPYGFGGPWWYDHDENPNTVPRDDNHNNIPDVIDWLLSQLQASYDDGWRRIVLYLPAGSVFNQEMSSSQWWPMPDWKREALKLYVRPWILAHTDTNVGVYMNITINDPCSLCQSGNAYSGYAQVPCALLNVPCPPGCPSQQVWYVPCLGRPTSHAPVPTSADDTCIFHQNVEPWLTSMGAKEIWFDAAAYGPNIPGYLEMINSPAYQGRMKAGGEAIPWAAHGVYDPVLMKKSACVGTSAYVNGQDPNHTWTFNIATTEAGYWLTRTLTLSEMHGFVGRGWVIWLHGIWDTRNNEYAKRIYSAGVIHDIADYNGDGVTNATDINDFNAAYNQYVWITNRQFNYVHGDLNQSGLVTTADKDLFFSAYNASLGGNPVQVNYGGPNPESALP